MVLNMADFGKFWKSLQTVWNDSYTLVKGFLTPCATFWVDFGWIRKCRKLAVFEQKAWAIAHGFEHGGFWQVLEIAPNPLKRLLNPSKRISNSLRDFLGRFLVNSQGRKLAVFEQKAWAIAHGFEHGGFWQVLEISRNCMKRLLYPCKWISNSLREFLGRFLLNSQVSKIGRFWAKSLGYSPWFWTWRILASSGNRSKLSERPPKPL